jgi:hypothetical protein
MAAYEELTGELLNVANPYLRKGETFRVSGTLQLNGKAYREIIFLKRNLRMLKMEKQGYLYITSDNTIISSKNVQKEIAKLAHYYEIFYSDEKGVGILTALQSEGDIERNSEDYGEVLKGLEFLQTREVEDIDKIKYVIDKLPVLRNESNEKINELAKLILENKKNNNTLINEEIIAKLRPLYEEVLRLNFEKVKLIGSLEDCCDKIKDSAEKWRKKWSVRLKRGAVGPLLKVEDEISYFRRIIRTYKSVLDMDAGQYSRFLSNMNKEKIDGRLSLIRE